MKAIIVLKPILIYAFATTQGNNNNYKNNSNKVRQQNIKGRNIWYIDAYNILGHAGTANNITTLTNQLLQIQPRTNTVILVLDGPKIIKNNVDSTTTSTDIASSTETATSSETSSTTTIERNGHFQKVILGDGLLADDYIVNEIRAMSTTTIGSTTSTIDGGILYDNNIQKNGQHVDDDISTMMLLKRNIVQVVTADRKLRQEVLNIKNPIKVRGVINPVTFWKRYIPRLCGMK